MKGMFVYSICLIILIWPVFIDLYTFDKDEDLAKVTYEKVCQAYERIFSMLELPIIKSKYLLAIYLTTY